MLYIIPLGVIIICLVLLALLVVRKFPDLVMINTDSIREERDSQTKKRITQEKLVRNIKTFGQKAKQLSKPVGRQINEQYQKFYQRIQELEKQTKQVSQPLKVVDGHQKAMELLEKARELKEQDQMDEAEEVYIEAISFDSDNITAYEELVELYRDERDYRKARETSRYLIKLLQKAGNAKEPEGIHNLAVGHADLGEIYELEAKNDLALKNYQKAVELQPANPRFLDLMLKISIIMKRKDLATQAFNDLKEADPDNQKLAEIQEEISQLPDNS